MARVNDNRNPKRTLSQKNKILNLLMHGMKLTRMDGLYLCGTMKLPERISDLRKEGWQIEDEWLEVDTKDGKKARVKAYHMKVEEAN